LSLFEKAKAAHEARKEAFMRRADRLSGSS
jgi:hypothetical protein